MPLMAKWPPEAMRRPLPIAPGPFPSTIVPILPLLSFSTHNAINLCARCRKINIALQAPPNVGHPTSPHGGATSTDCLTQRKIRSHKGTKHTKEEEENLNGWTR